MQVAVDHGLFGEPHRQRSGPAGDEPLGLAVSDCPETWNLAHPDKVEQVARAYGAVCTPDFFGYNRDLKLQYRGRLDASRKETAPGDVRRDLFEAMKQVAETGRGPADQIPSMGCSIKWKNEAA